MWLEIGNDQSHNKRIHQISTEGVKDELPLGQQVDPTGKCARIKIWPHQQIVYAQPST